MFAEEDPPAFNARIEVLVDTLNALPDAGARETASELARRILEFHAAGLERLLRIVADAPSAVRTRIAEDSVIAALLALHDLPPPDGATGRNGHGRGDGTTLIQIARRGEGEAARPLAFHHDNAARCERCGAPIAAAHYHHVDLESRRFFCSCRACWLVPAAHGGGESVRAVPDRYVSGPFSLTDPQWDALDVPVGMAFFMFNSTMGRMIAFYPSRAGATESALPLAAWCDVERVNPWLRSAEPDVEAIVLRKSDATRYDAFIVPIDACYDLVGRIRACWAGCDGGDAVRAEVDRFCGDARARSAGAAASAPGAV
jgi:hypothetical protein